MSTVSAGRCHKEAEITLTEPSKDCLKCERCLFSNERFTSGSRSNHQTSLRSVAANRDPVQSLRSVFQMVRSDVRNDRCSTSGPRSTDTYRIQHVCPDTKITRLEPQLLPNERIPLRAGSRLVTVNNRSFRSIHGDALRVLMVRFDNPKLGITLNKVHHVCGR
jgi:hypothetical protein